MIEVIWSTIAAQDLDDIVSWILEHHSSEHAESFVDMIDASVRQLSQQPQSGRVIPELERQNITKYREVVSSPWRLFYAVDSDRVLIHAVIDGRRNIEDILLRRNIR
ncbi:MAG: type II toxin-antitoxin system RelE/ParE family toxin [Spirochaeta sp.]|jgi:toxin ParE1/3/4|nr:type II toxin-antitoxin system RelE/ParE family toxin [Spirochaeta sp.]